MPVWAQLCLPLLTGFILLVIEYRTGFFDRGVSAVQRRTDRAANLLTGQSVSPVTELENPVGDWMQIAREIKALLVEEYDLEPGELYLDEITRKSGNRAKLKFRYVVIIATGAGCVVGRREIVYTVRVDAEGRITSFTRRRGALI